MPEASRDAMRNAFQEGFDKSKGATKLLSEDECKRLTQSRIRPETVDETNIEEQEKKPEIEQKVVEQELPPEEPKLRHLRIAEISGQLAYKRKICDGDEVFTRDYNAFMESVPEEYQEEVKAIYWKGYKHGKRMNPDLTSDNGC
jgi:predicted secreted protein